MPARVSSLSEEGNQTHFVRSWPKVPRLDQTSQTLSEPDEKPESDEDSISVPPRFDWRMRAPSRGTQRLVQETNEEEKNQDETGVRSVPKSPVKGYVWKTMSKRVAPIQAKEWPGQPYFEEIVEYKKHFLPLLDAEQKEAELIRKERLSSWSTDKLVGEGYCIQDLGAYWSEQNERNVGESGRYIAVFSLGPGKKLPSQHMFEPGTPITLSRKHPLEEEPITGVVDSYDSIRLCVAFSEMIDLFADQPLDEGRWRLDLGHSDIVFARMRAAIDSLAQDPVALHRKPFIKSQQPEKEYVLQGTELRDVLLRSFSPSPEKHHGPHVLQAPDDRSYPGHEGLDHLNAKQSQADAQSVLLSANSGSLSQGGTPNLLQGQGAFKDNLLIQSWARRYAKPRPVKAEGDPILKGLNESQTRAAALMVGERISLVQGPPGTGKTKTIAETIKLLKGHFEVPHPLLICTYTNVAVDNLIGPLLEAGMKPLRVSPSSSSSSSKKAERPYHEHTLDYKLETHPLAPELKKCGELYGEQQKKVKALKRDIEELGGKDGMGTRTPLDAKKQKTLEAKRALANSVEQEAQRSKANMYRLRQQMLYDIVRSSDVVCTTCITSASQALKVIDFPVVFIDEASMSTEAASLIPLMKGSQHVALIGDHKQLPPVVVSEYAQAQGLGISLFERLTEEGRVPSIMLDVQYRMHPAISRFPAQEFYNGALLDGTVNDDGRAHPHLSPPAISTSLIDSDRLSNSSVIFFHHEGEETFSDRSRLNTKEAHIICGLVEDILLRNPELSGNDIGIIAPYAAQITHLSRLFSSDPTVMERLKESLGPLRAMQLLKIEVKTVDGFEGREKDVIIFSTVRNNPNGSIGFLADRRRLNVGLTRAKRALFVLGNIDTLRVSWFSGSNAHGVVRYGRGAEAWRRFAKYLDDNGLVVPVKEATLAKLVLGS